MTIEEIKAEAKKHGYTLIKINKYEKLAPCKCGRKHLTRWIKFEGGIQFECPICGATAPVGKNEREARHNWNIKMGASK